MQQSLLRCHICLTDDDGLPEAPWSVGEPPTGAETVWRCGGCQAAFHRSCVGGHALAAVLERGEVAVACPLPGCREPWPAEVLAWSLDEAELLRYLNAVRSVEEMRAQPAPGSSTPSPGAELSETMLRRLSLRNCPRCHSLIQKQAEGLLSGCDKMTCRCGCMFCFRCGLEAREGGVARCRCVGMHHRYIPHSEVLSNYSGPGGFAGDQDLVKRPRGAPSKQAAARLRKELRVALTDPSPYVHISCNESNILVWDFLIEGPPGTPYDGGWYWGRLDVPKDYPFWPPLVRMRTPSGYFEPDSWLCRTVLDYHPEGWQPPWTLASVLMALLALMCDDDSFTSGTINPRPPAAERARLAQESLAWNRAHADFMRAFPSIDSMVAGAQSLG